MTKHQRGWIIAAALWAVLLTARNYQGEIVELGSHWGFFHPRNDSVAVIGVPGLSSKEASQTYAEGASQLSADGRLVVDLNASWVEVVDGTHVIHVRMVNTGMKEGWARALKLTFKKDGKVIGGWSYPRAFGPIAPGADFEYSQEINDPPEGTTEIIPSLE